MKLLIIYGPPAVGKLTVARAVSEETGMKVFHNHLSIDAVTPVFEFGTPSFSRLVRLIRLETIAEAARTDTDLIFTVCYAQGEDDENIRHFAAAAEGNGGEALFVQLKCSPQKLEERIVSETRLQFGKLATIEMLHGLLGRHELFSPVPGRDSLLIDNTELPPDQAAEMICAHFGLTKIACA